MVTNPVESNSSNPSAGVSAAIGINAYSANVPSGQSAMHPRRVRACSQADQDLRRIFDILCGDEMRRQHHALTRLQMPDIPGQTASTTPDPVVPIVNGPGGWIVDGQFSFT